MLQKEVYSLNVPFETRTKQKSKKRPNTRDILEQVIVVIICILIGRIILFNEIAPLGVAFFCTLYFKRSNRISAFLAVGIGVLSSGMDGYALKYIGAMIIIFLYGHAPLLKSLKWSTVKAALVTAFALMVSGFIHMYPKGIITYDVILLALESAIGFMMVYIFARIVDILSGKRKRRILSGEEIISLSIFFSLIIIGMWDFNIIGFSLRGILSIALILLFGYIGGSGIGASIGITVGFILSISGLPDPILIGVLGVAGLMAGTFRDLGRIGTVCAFALANALMTFYINKSTFVIIPFGEIAAAGIILLVTPVKGINYLKQYLDYSMLKKKDQDNYIQRMQDIIIGRLNEFSQVFLQMSRVFSRISEHKAPKGKEDISKLFDLVAEDVCVNCGLYRSCWQRDFYNTYNFMFELLASAESNGEICVGDLQKVMSKRCIQPEKLVDSLNNVYNMFVSNLKWQKRIDDCQHLVADQLKGISTVVSQLAMEMDMNVRFKKDLEDIIELELDKRGVRVGEVLVIEKNSGKMEINITKRECSGNKECTKVIEKVVSRVAGKRMTHLKKECAKAGKDSCLIHMVEAEEYNILTGIARKAKGGKQICGDSYSFSTIKDGKYMMALSDGMGSGKRASEESGAVIALIENFMEAGFDQDISIRTINSVLALRSREEIYATADLCIIDLISGSADFIKIGGVSTFIRRKENVEVVKASTLPIGILDSVQSEKVTCQLNDEEMVVMVTDGILDVVGPEGDSDEWLANTIAEYDTRNPQELADYIMEKAIEYTDGESKDDMTVMVARIWKPLYY